MALGVTLSLALILVAARPAYAQIYKWVDSQGVTHYSEAPPPGGAGKASVLELPQAKSPPDQGPASTQQSWQAQDQEFRERQAKKADLHKQEEEREAKSLQARRNACLNAQASLDLLNRQGRLYNVNEQGEKIYLNDDDRQRQSQLAQQRIAENCGS
jgi:hypothetical protein